MRYELHHVQGGYVVWDTVEKEVLFYSTYKNEAVKITQRYNEMSEVTINPPKGNVSDEQRNSE